MEQISNADAISSWGKASQESVESFSDEGDFTRKYLLNAVIFALLGDVKGKRILDAGCGQGYLSRLLAKRGAQVTGVEPAEAWYRYAQRQEAAEQLGITYQQADLSSWTSPSETFDYVIANMVFMDIPDFQPALHNCVQALKHRGELIFSLLHPCFEETGAAWKEKGYVEIRDYFQERAIKQNLGHFIHRPLSTYLNSILQEGCTIQNVIEPQLDEAIASQHNAERYWHVPGYIVISASKAF